MIKKRFVLLAHVTLAVLFYCSCSSPAPEPEEPAPIPLDGRGGGVIAYATGAPMQLWGVNADGSGNRQLTHAAIGLNHHDWSPDGRRFALVGYIGNGNDTWAIHVVDADGNNLTRLTNVDGVWDSDPDWSPDGGRIAFTRIYPNQDYRCELWVMNADGSDPRWLGVEGFAAKWSADGSRFLFGTAVPVGSAATSDLYTCRADGSDVRQLTHTAYGEFYPSWSPDGGRIVFRSNRDDADGADIYVMNSDGSNLRRLTANPSWEDVPRWSNDGSLIAFTSDMTGKDQFEIYVMNADGSNVRRVTQAAVGERSINAAWRPAAAAACRGEESETDETENRYKEENR